MTRKISIHPGIGGGFILVVAQALAFFLAFREKAALEQMQITPPEVSVQLPLLYFFAAVVIVGLVLFLVPQAGLRVVLKILFLLLFAWGNFIALIFLLPEPAAAGALSMAIALLWFFMPRVWLHNLLLLVTLAAVGTTFGLLLAPWAAVVFMAVISVYDLLAVRFGYMMWMVKRLSVADIMPAFVIPITLSGWNLNLKKAKFFEEEAEREFSILGGGDIGFPLLLIVSVFFAYGFARSLVVAGFALLGLAAAYVVQRIILKGKPTPALPPITLLSVAGFLIVYFA
jgi:presenilin-like A22 family membrane protease